jgi:hypothetical protein
LRAAGLHRGRKGRKSERLENGFGLRDAAVLDV